MSARASVLVFLLLVFLAAGGCGGGGSNSAALRQEQLAPAPVPAKLVTLIGSRESKGLHWIIIGDGFTADQLDDLRASALALGRELIDTPELAQHNAVWNVHLLEAISPESGIDDAAAKRFVDTAFDGALGCGSNARVACVDWARVQAALQAEHAPQAQLTVIINTPEYLGSSNSSGIVVSRHTSSRQVAVHEMGHRVAGLADEYVDEVVASEWLPLYIEGRFPNVTRVSNAGQAPWRHWLNDSEKGVGLFEGAFYSASGFYRAKEDSLMRTLDAPLGEVNAEAWLRAQYRVLPPLSGFSPAEVQVQALSGDTVNFSVVSEWPAGTVELRWQVDGIEIPGAVDSKTFTLMADGLTHQVAVAAHDVSGRIRAPDATEATAGHAWTVSPNAAPATPKMTAVRPIASWLEVRVDADGHRVLRVLDVAPAAAAFGPSAELHWQYALQDEDGLTLATGGIVDPRITWTALSAPGQPHAGHQSALLDSGVYYVGIPQGVEPRKLRIAATAAGMEKLGGAGGVPAGAIELSLDTP